MEKVIVVSNSKSPILVKNTLMNFRREWPRRGARVQIDREQFEAVVKEWRADKITAVEAMKRLDIKPNTFYRRVKEWGL